MIIDRKERMAQYVKAVPAIGIVLDFLARTDVSALPGGRVEIAGGVYAAVNLYTAKNTELYEAHRKYIDLQYMVSGCEDMFSAPIGACGEANEYSEEKDCQMFAKAEDPVRMTVKAGDFAVFFPWDVHKPGQLNAHGQPDIRKLVFKIPMPEYEDELYLAQTVKLIGMEPAVADEVMDTYHKLGSLLTSVSDSFFAGNDIDAIVGDHAESMGVTREMGYLTAYLLLGKTTLYRCLAENDPYEMWIDSMRDFAIWPAMCRKKTGHAGVYNTGWLASTLRWTTWRIGRFQFQRTRLSRDLTVGGIPVKAGMPILRIHIPEGGHLTDEVRHDAYERAYRHFKAKNYATVDDGYMLFICETWLFYPAHREFLPKTSYLLRFMDDFTMISSDEAIGTFDNMWRVFGFPENGYEDFDALPHDTGLQRAYIEHLKKTRATGGAEGVFLFNGKTYKK